MPSEKFHKIIIPEELEALTPRDDPYGKEAERIAKARKQIEEDIKSFQLEPHKFGSGKSSEENPDEEFDAIGKLSKAQRESSIRQASVESVNTKDIKKLVDSGQISAETFSKVKEFLVQYYRRDPSFKDLVGKSKEQILEIIKVSFNLKQVSPTVWNNMAKALEVAFASKK